MEKQSNRSVAKQYGVDDSAVQRHRQHIPELLVKASQAMEVVEADHLIDQMRGLQQRALGILDKAEEADDLRTALTAIAQARGNLELLAKLQGELQQEGTININTIVTSKAFVKLQSYVVSALSLYPDALETYKATLKELSNGGG